VLGTGMTGNEQYRISSYNRSKKKFIVLVYSGGATGKAWADVSIPSTIQNGRYYNNEHSVIDFRGEGIQVGQKYSIKIISKDLNRENGSDVNVKQSTDSNRVAEDGLLKARISGMNKFTLIEFSATR